MAFARKQGFVHINWLRLILGNMMSFNLVVRFYPKATGKCVSLVFVFICQIDVVMCGTHCPRGCWWLPPGTALSQRMLPHSNSRSFPEGSAQPVPGQWVARPCHNLKEHTRSKFPPGIFWGLWCHCSRVQICPLPIPALIASLPMLFLNALPN